MTAEIVLQVFRFGFLLLLWLFIYAAFRVVRADLFGGRAGRVASVPPRAAATKKKKGPRGPRTLVVIAGPLKGTRITLGEQPILIGRADDSTLVLTDDYASTRHARLSPRGSEWYVEDLGSTNGTYLDRAKVTTAVRVPMGTPVRIGKTVIELRP
jgi:hypothetical protein